MLTYLERKQIQEGNRPDIGLVKLIALIALDFAVDFRENCKQFETVDNTDPENPVAINTDANRYKQQMLNLCGRVINSDSSLVNSALKLFITILGRTNYTYSQISEASETQWVNFIKTGNPANATGYDGIKLIFEHIAGTSNEGKTEYDNL